MGRQLFELAARYGNFAIGTRHPWRRNLLMIVAHLVWGVTLGELMQKLTTRDQE